MSRSTFAGRFAAAVLVPMLVAVVVRPAAAEVRLTYIPPVSSRDGVVVDHFRAPPTPYAAGNRGLDYATVPGSPVVASADGVVVFAGRVAGALYVTVLHPDGLRTTSSYLASVVVVAGQHVHQGQTIGVTGRTFHFGVRDAAGDYLDPESLFAGHLGAHLLPDAGAPGAPARPSARASTPAATPVTAARPRPSPTPVGVAAGRAAPGAPSSRPERWWRLAIRLAATANGP
jgi:murein DD-endopeptidase MepM/ murein hydrolase activator NlpD